MNDLVEISDFLWPAHRQRCEKVLDLFHSGRMNVSELTERLRGFGFNDGEIRAEIALHERVI
jgi:hypothetical protein